MKALTLHRPWPWAIFHLPEPFAKRVENRTWAPPASLLGETIAIHAGKTFDGDACYFIDERAGFLSSPPMSPEPDAHPLGIIGTVRIVGWYDARTSTGYAHTTAFRREAFVASPWYMGAVGWLLDEVRTLPEPVPCRGAQGLWTVPADVEARVNEQLLRKV